MSRKKRMQNVREAKDRRMKKIAIGAGIVLVALLAFEIPHFLGGKKTAAPPATTTATTPGTTAPATSTPATAPVTAAPTASAKLTNSDLPPRSSKAQLTSFSTFASKDPFVPQIPADTGTTGPGSGSGSAPASGAPTSSGPVVTSTRMLAHSGAVMLMVNGRRESVRVGAGFPSSNPIFRLVSVTNGAVRIGIANGSYESGAQTVLLRPNRTITLIDTTNHAHYKLQLLLGS